MLNSQYEIHNIAKTHRPFIFHCDAVKSSARSHVSNWHENVEIIYHRSGSGYVLIDASRFEIKDSNITVINSNSIHSFNSDSEVHYDCLIIDNSFFTDNGIDIKNIRFSPSIYSDKVKRLFANVSELINKSENEPDLLDTARIRSALLALVIELCEHHVETGVYHIQYSTERVKEIISYINSNLESRLTLEDISRHVKMSKYHLCREFKVLTGKTVFEFINTVRCTEAKRKIREGVSVSEAAFTVGFESLSYFTKKFKETIGKLPSEYKRKE